MPEPVRPPTARTVPALLAEMASRDPSRIALIDRTRRWTYEQLDRDTRRVAAALAGRGIEHGDRVGILAGNCAEWVIGYFAAMHLGAVAVGLNTWSTAHEFAYQLAHAEVKMLLVEPRFRESDFLVLLNEARALDAGLPALHDVVTFGKVVPEYTDFATWLVPPEAELSDRLSKPVTPDDVACLLYTSGSTALPKGVPLLHHGLIENMWEIGERQHLLADDRLWLAVSLFWSLACVNALFAVVTHGGTVVLQHHFDAGDALELISSERCTVFYGTPNMALALAEHPRLSGTDISSLRTGVTIGTAAQVRRIAELGVDEICNVYGLTEAYGNSTVTDARMPLDRRVETVGTALAGVEVRIADPDTGAILPHGTAGEIVLRGRVTPGYWNDSERTAEAMTTDGAFRTGDLGMLDDEGCLYYRGRLKEMVKTGGINVAPAEVEEVLSAHPAVELAFVTGLPDPRLDEMLAAVIVIRDGATADPESLAAHCRETLAAYKTPRQFRFVTASELPLTSTGKLQRKRLAELFA